MGKQSDTALSSGRKSPFGIPLQNGLGIENWPPEVQDELNRVHPKGNYFIPDEELLVAGLDGRPLSDPWGFLGEFKASLTRDDALLAALDYEPDPADQAADDFLREAEEASAACSDKFPHEDEDHPLALLEKSRQYYREMYPWLFDEERYDELDMPFTGDEPVSFHGVTRQNIFKKSKTDRANPNSKRKRIRYLSLRRDSIRTAYFDVLSSKAEMLALIAEAEMSKRFDKHVDAQMII